ncbi:MAG: RecQ family ATP-dependent DNA helicase [Acidimicrobiales bacterium]
MTPLDDVIDQLLESGPVSLEHAHRRLVGLDAGLAARGAPWLREQLRRHPDVRVLPGSRFEWRPVERTELELVAPSDAAATRLAPLPASADGQHDAPLPASADDQHDGATDRPDSAEQRSLPPAPEDRPAADDEVPDSDAITGRPEETVVFPEPRALGETFVVFDIEANADRALPEEHEIIELAACKVTGGGVVEEFSTFVVPDRPLASFVTELTGLTDQQVSTGQPLREALAAFFAFCDGWPLIAHNGFGYDFKLIDASLVRARLPAFAGERLDSLELAHVFAPRAGIDVLPDVDGTVPPKGRSLEYLSELLPDNTEPVAHRALDDARATVAILAMMLEALSGAEPDRCLQRELLHRSGHPWSAWLSEAPDVPILEQVVPQPQRRHAAPPTGSFDPIDAVAPLAEGGELVAIAGRRYRVQQEEMASSIADAFVRGERCMIEAPTGTGKTLAYLVPAIAWAQAQGEPVVVATHSKVLQSQILASLHEIELTLGPVNWVLIKGMENYVSLDALDGALDGASGDALEALALAVIVGWVARTPTGDWDDLRAWSLEERLPGFATLRWRLSIDSDPGVAITPLDDLCFFRRALEGLESADLAIVNHAVLLRRSAILEDGDYLVLDEAHNLEESATAALTENVSAAAVDRLLATLHDPVRKWGTLGRYLDATNTSRSDPAIARVVEALDVCRAANDELGPLVIEYVRSRSAVSAGEIARFGVSYRLRRGFDTDRAAFRPLRTSAGALAHALIELADALQGLAVPAELRRPYRQRRLEDEIARMGRTARGCATTLIEIVDAVDEEQWINLLDVSRTTTQWTWTAQRVPLEVAGRLAELWGELSSVVLTSATLRVAGSMEHLVARLGLRSVVPKVLPSPFAESADNAMLVLPDHLPTPRGGLMDEFALAEADEFARLFMLTGGRAMGLFTARSRMTAVRDHVRPILEPVQIPVLCQGDEPAPALVDRMRHETTTSLLATRSFWEGVDIPGEALSLLVIEKLPFSSPADPIIAARMEALERKGLDPFGSYLIPEAVLRFVQGYGRLIRSEEDVGVAVLLDKRLRKPVRYRETFLDSLPGPPKRCQPDTAVEGYRAIADHLGVPCPDDLLAAVLGISSIDPWADIEEMELSDVDITDSAVVLSRLEKVRERLGFDSWRPGQLEVMTRFVAGQDVLAVLPTGTGKSLTFQIPALLRPGLTMVVSPLVALMRDQVEGLRARGLTKVASIHSGQSMAEQDEVLARARAGAYKLLYVSPERLWSQRFRQSLGDVDVARLVVDEAHCISQWGHSFRPEYASIPAAIASLTEGRRPAILAATATATPKVRAEIVDNLGLRLRDGALETDPDRQELRYYIEQCSSAEDREVRLLQILDSFRGSSAIVYVPSKAKATQLAQLLRADNHVAQPYHGGMESALRLYTEEAFREGEIDVVVATKAFGLGIDKPDIALVVHLEMPLSVEEYIQETGRAARGAIDGSGPEHGACVLLASPRDCWIHGLFIKSAAPELDVARATWTVLAGGEHYLTVEDLTGRVKAVVGSQVESEQVAMAVHYLVQVKALQRYEDMTWEGRVQVHRDSRDLYDAARARGVEFPPHTRTILDHCVARGSSDFHLMTWAERLGMEPSVIERNLLELHRRDVLGFVGWRTALHLRAIEDFEPDFAAIRMAADARRRAVRQLSDDAKAYRSNEHECRRYRLLTYLGVDVARRCEACDVCVPDLPRPWKDSDISREHLDRAIPAPLVILGLVEDLAGGDFSRRNIERCLLGDTDGFDLHPRLQDHPQFGMLGALGARGVTRAVDDLIASGQIVEADVEKNGRPWVTLRPSHRIEGEG